MLGMTWGGASVIMLLRPLKGFCVSGTCLWYSENKTPKRVLYQHTMVPHDGSGKSDR